jgi:ankyrin repeat protein
MADRKISNIFVRHCAENNLEEVARLLAAGEDPNQIDKGIKVKTDDFEAHQPDGNEPNSFGSNGMEMAFQNHNMKLVRMLVEGGADPYFINDHFNKHLSMLESAIGSGFVEGVKYLLDECGCELACSDGKSPRNELIMKAIRIDSMASKDSAKDAEKAANALAMLRYLVEEHMLKPDYVGERNQRPITYANGIGYDSSLLKYFLDKGVKPNFDAKVKPLLKLAFAEGAKNDVEDITKESFSSFELMMRLSKKYSGTLLAEACFEGDIPKVEILLSYGADPTYADSEGVRAIDLFMDKQFEKSVFWKEDEHGNINKMVAEATKRLYPGVSFIGKGNKFAP